MGQRRKKGQPPKDRDCGALTPEPRPRNPFSLLFVCAGLLFAVVLVFGQTACHDFVNFDDGLYVVENPQVTRGLTARGIAWVFTHSHGGNWHPLTSVSHMLDCQFYGLKPEGHHLTNVALHAATAILLFLVLRQMTGGLWPSALVAAVFAVHPLRVESVAWVAERKDVLSGLLFVSILGAYLGYVRRPFSLLRYLAVMALFALGLMAKPMLVTVPLVLLLLDIWPLGRLTGMVAADAARVLPTHPMRLIVEKIPLAVLAAGSCVATFLAQGKSVASSEGVPLFFRIANALVSYVAYLGQFFYPAGLAVFYPHPEDDLPTWKVAAALLVLVGISLGGWSQRRNRPYLLVGWLWYLGMLVPVIGLVQVGQQGMADRYTYLPQIGLSLAVVLGLIDVSRSWSFRRWIWGATSAAVLAGLMGCAWRQTSYWRTSETLWTHTLGCTSRNALAHLNLGLILQKQGRGDEAIAQWREALDIKPNYAEAHVNLGAVLADRGCVDEGIAHYRMVLSADPEQAEAHNNFGLILQRQKKVDEAIAHWQKALELRPDHAEARYNLANALVAKGRTDEAMTQYREALEVNPDYSEAHTNLGVVLAGRGRGDEAMAHYQRVLEINPKNATAQNNLGAFLAGCGRVEEAMAHYRKALEIKPDYADALVNLGNALAGRGRRDEATVQYRQALAVNPKSEGVHHALGVILVGQGRFDEAMAHYRKALAIRPDYPEVACNLGVILFRQGRVSEAMEVTRRALDLVVARGDTAMANTLRARIQFYQTGSPPGETRPPNP